MCSVSVKVFLNILLFQLVMLFCFSFFAFKNYDDHVMSWVYRIIPNEKVEYNNIIEYND